MSATETCSSKRSQPETTQAATSKALRAGLPGPLQFTSYHSMPQTLDMQTQDVMLTLLGLGRTLI